MILISLLAPTVLRAKAAARAVACQAKLREIGVLLQNYSSERASKYLLPNMLQVNTDWVQVIGLPVDSTIRVCSDADVDFERNSYMYNVNVSSDGRTLARSLSRRKISPAAVAIVGENRPRSNYTIFAGPFFFDDFYGWGRHKKAAGPIILFFDYHVSATGDKSPQEVERAWLVR
jgi:hypothetical protein